MLPPSKLAQALRAIADAWQSDPFRPHLQLKTFLRSLADHPKLTREAVDAAALLQRNGIQKKYPLSDKTLRPISKPNHYERLAEAHEKAAQGIGRPFWKRFFGIW